MAIDKHRSVLGDADQDTDVCQKPIPAGLGIPRLALLLNATVIGKRKPDLARTICLPELAQSRLVRAAGIRQTGFSLIEHKSEVLPIWVHTVRPMDAAIHVLLPTLPLGFDVVCESEASSRCESVF